jgi:hypothetical protein
MGHEATSLIKALRSAVPPLSNDGYVLRPHTAKPSDRSQNEHMSNTLTSCLRANSKQTNPPGLSFAIEVTRDVPYGLLVQLGHEHRVGIPFATAADPSFIKNITEVPRKITIEVESRIVVTLPSNIL